MKARKRKQELRENIRNVKTWLAPDVFSKENQIYINRYIVKMQNKLKKK